MDVGARHLLFASGDVIGKLPWGPSVSCERECLALEHAPPGLTPSLLGDIHLPSLREEALDQRDWEALLDLDLPLGHGFLMARWGGEHLDTPVSDVDMEAVGKVLAELHQPMNHDIPRLQVPSQATSMLRVLDDLFAEIKERACLPREGIAVIQHAIRQAKKQVELWRKMKLPKVRTLCHGDLRWHNMMMEEGMVHLLDWEHAGVGDPVVDVAMMVSRTPLSSFDELRLLDAYTLHSQDDSFLDRYFSVRPLVGLLCVLGALLFQVEIAEGYVPLGMDPSQHSEERFPALVAELYDALDRMQVHTTKDSLSPQRLKSKPFESYKGWVALDGTSASLKSPFAEGLARALHVPYFNTGLVYRCIALRALCLNLEPSNASDVESLCQFLVESPLQLSPKGSLVLHDDVVSECFLISAVEEQVGVWASLPVVREAVKVVLQRSFSTYESGVVEGRDIGSVVLPHAAVKMFVDAPVSTRARLLAERTGSPEKEAKQWIHARDRQDKERDIAPLLASEGAIEVKLEPRTFSKQMERMVALCRERLNG